MNLLSHYFTAALLALFLVAPAIAQQSPAPDFIPDVVHDGARLTDWQTTGNVQWSAADGVITGDAANGGGWLMLPDAFQNVAMFSRFRCQGACDAGIVLRAEKTDAGTKGIMVALQGESIEPVRVVMDKDGKIVSRESAQNRQRPGGNGETSPYPVLATATAELTAPVAIQPGQWNTIEIFVDGNFIYNHLNNARNAIPHGTVENLPPPEAPTFGGAVVPPITTTYGYGSIALYVGKGRVEFDDVAIKDLNVLRAEPERTSDRFRVQRVNAFYYGWGADVADIDNDGEPDLISGPFYYLGPDFLTRHEFYPARVFNPGLEYINDMITFANDWNGDGWVDVVLTERRPLVLHVNPQGEKRYWDRIEILPDVCSETAIRADVDGDGAPEIAYVGSDGRVAYGEPDPAHPNDPWLVRKISDPIIEGCNSHGLGVGDVNGDGLADMVHARGWWEQPKSGPDQGEWIHHDDWFGRLTRSPQHPGGAEIAIYDFNGDGLSDIVTSLSAHGWGLAWYAQKRDAAGKISFDEHMLIGDFSTENVGGVTFSQPHSGATLGDIDRDGVMDFVTGKRHWSHLDAFTDPDPNGEAVIYWYRTVRNPDAPGGVAFEPELIHNKSGVGSEVKVLDINQDGMLDIVSSGSMGTFIFWGVK